MGRYQLTPLSYEALDHAGSFASDQCAEGICAIAKSSLRILTVERLGEVFNQQVRNQLVLDRACQPAQLRLLGATSALVSVCQHALW